MYYNVICEEISILGGKIIHEDEIMGDLIEVLRFIEGKINCYPNGKWEIYPFSTVLK